MSNEYTRSTSTPRTHGADDVTTAWLMETNARRRILFLMIKIIEEHREWGITHSWIPLRATGVKKSSSIWQPTCSLLSGAHMHARAQNNRACYPMCSVLCMCAHVWRREKSREMAVAVSECDWYTTFKLYFCKILDTSEDNKHTASLWDGQTPVPVMLPWHRQSSYYQRMFSCGLCLCSQW